MSITDYLLVTGAWALLDVLVLIPLAIWAYRRTQLPALPAFAGIRVITLLGGYATMWLAPRAGFGGEFAVLTVTRLTFGLLNLAALVWLVISLVNYATRPPAGGHGGKVPPPLAPDLSP